MHHYLVNWKNIFWDKLKLLETWKIYYSMFLSAPFLFNNIYIYIYFYIYLITSFCDMSDDIHYLVNRYTHNNFVVYFQDTNFGNLKFSAVSYDRSLSVYIG